MSQEISATAFRMGVLAVVLCAGWVARRRAWLGETATRWLGRLCVDVCFPCLTFVQMLQIVGRNPVAEQSYILLLGLVLMGVALLGGLIFVHDLPPEPRRTAWLAAAMPNWLFFPLPIATLLYGEQGLATVLLVNVTAQFYLWTTSVGILRGFRNTIRTGLVHLLNPGLIASVAGVLIAIFWPGSHGWVERPGAVGHLWRFAEAIGSLTIPLSMLVTGAQLGAIPRGWRIHTVTRRATRARLLWLPLLTTLLLWVCSHWVALPGAVWRTSVMIAAMPVAVSCGVLVERYGGDRDLVSQMTLVTTVFAIVTVPLQMLLGHWLFP